MNSTPALPGSEQEDDYVLRFRSIWISDIHLGTRGCQAERLLDFLRHTESDYLYLVGDIVDGWHLRRRWYWPQAHNDVVQKILRRARHGTKVFYVPGNHDEGARPFCGLHFGGVYVVNEIVHETAAGLRMLILHGDQFDAVVGYAKWLAHLGDKAYDVALYVNRIYNMIRRRLGMPYWSLSAYLKHKVKNAVAYIGLFETYIAEHAARENADAVLCGHIHHAEMRQIGNVLYLTDGDWVESCTALVEDFDGKLSIIRWAEERESLLTPLLAKA
ncbi:MAG: UDP-2,3-diacylglucosamine diphosphatase [Alphaproteobacteria bacterium]|nr:UDP-2,3-diacylglucosamine diphosphatase [Alphaproteobacteria bacterium]